MAPYATRSTSLPPRGTLVGVPREPDRTTPARHRGGGHSPIHTDRDVLTDALFAELARATTPAAHDAVVERICVLYLDLCATLAGRYSGRGVEQDDLEQVARLALVGAVGRYRPGSGPSFAAYAVPTITGELKRHFRDKAWLVRPPRRLQELRADATAERERLEQDFGRPVTDAEVAQSLSSTAAEVREAVATGQYFHADPLEQRMRDDDNRSVERGIAWDDVDLDGADDRVTIGRAMRHLSSADRDLLRRRFVEDLSQREIGEALGVSQMQVSRALRRVLGTLRERIA
jgi:RNA polymerase sigma-B factor